MIEFIELLRTKHRATLDRLTKEGKSYRSRDVTWEHGYLNALQDIQDAIELPAKNKAMEDTMAKWRESQ